MRHPYHAFAPGLLVGGLLSLAAGCATAPPSPLQESHDRAVRHLSSQCFRQLDAERYVLGGYSVLVACRRWAEDRVRIRMPADVRVTPD